MQGHIESAGPQSALVASSFEQIYRAHLAYVWTNLRGLGVDERDLEDATQDVFLVYHRRCTELDHVPRLRPWLFGVARRVAARYRRSHARRHRLWHGLAAEPTATATVGLEQEAQLREATRLVDEFLRRLDEDKRVVFVLAELQQRTAREIASILGVRSNTVSSRLRLGRRAFDRHFARLRARDTGLGALGPRPNAHVILSYARSGYRPTRSQRARVVAAIGVEVRRLATTTSVATGVAGAGSYVATIAGVLVVAVLGVDHLRGSPAPPDVEMGAPRVWEVTHAPGKESPTLVDPPSLAAAGVGPVAAPPPTVPPPSPPRRSTEASGLPAASPSRSVHRGDRRPADSTSRSSPAPRSPPESVALAASSLAEETRLLAKARTALRAGDPRGALALTDEHAQRFRTSALAFERTKLKISALCASGRRTRARTELEALRARAPAASIASNIDGLCPRR